MLSVCDMLHGAASGGLEGQSYPAACRHGIRTCFAGLHEAAWQAQWCPSREQIELT